MSVSFSFDHGEYEGTGDIQITTSSPEFKTRVFVDGVEYARQAPKPTKYYRAVKDKDAEYWVEIREGVWRCVRPSPMDCNERKLDQIVLKYGPLATE
jgi:hypothetical protein